VGPRREPRGQAGPREQGRKAVQKKTREPKKGRRICGGSRVPEVRREVIHLRSIQQATGLQRRWPRSCSGNRTRQKKAKLEKKRRKRGKGLDTFKGTHERRHAVKRRVSSPQKKKKNSNRAAKSKRRERQPPCRGPPKDMGW